MLISILLLVYLSCHFRRISNRVGLLCAIALFFTFCKRDDESERLVLEEQIVKNQDDTLPQEDEQQEIELLLVGVDKRTVNPPEGMGITMSGFSGRTEAFSGIHDDLFVRTLVIEDQDDGQITIHVSIDMLNIGGEVFYEIYQRIIAEVPEFYNLPLSNLFVSATHNHGGPSVHTAQAASYKSDRTESIVSSIKAAWANKTAAKMKVGLVQAFNVNTNRQFPHSTGECELEVYPDGNSDKDAHFVEFVNEEDQSIASIVSFGVHSTVMGLHNLQITSDLAGYTSRHIENEVGNGHVCLFLYTGGGDQSPVVRTQDKHLIDHPQTGVKAFGDRLGAQIYAGFSNGELIPKVEIKTDTMALPLERDYEPKDDVSDGTEVRALYGIKYSDDFIVISTPFELFSSTVQELKACSPYKHTLILSLTNGVGHYIPPAGTYNLSFPYDHGWQCYENRTSIFTSSAEATFKTKCQELIQKLGTN